MLTGDSVLLQLPEDDVQAVGAGCDGRDLGTRDVGALTAAGVGLTGMVVATEAGEGTHGVFVGVNAE